MKKLVCFGLMILLFVSIIGLASGCVDPNLNERVDLKPVPLIEGKLIAFKFQGGGYGGSGLKYWLFVEGQTFPRSIDWRKIEFIYDDSIKDPRAEVFRMISGQDEAKVWFRDKAQFREYLR